MVTSGSSRDSAMVQAILDLVAAVPELGPIVESDRGCDGEILAYIALARFRWSLVEFVEAGNEAAIAAFLAEVERLAGSPSDSVRNLIAIAFLEDGVILSGGRERDALTSLLPRFGLGTMTLLAETEAHYASLVELSRTRPHGKRHGRRDSPSW